MTVSDNIHKLRMYQLNSDLFSMIKEDYFMDYQYDYFLQFGLINSIALLIINSSTFEEN